MTARFARIGRFAVRFRLPVVLGTVAVLAVCAAPLLDVSLSNGDARSLPSGSEPRLAYQVQEAHWGNASTSPISVIFEGRGTAYTAFAQIVTTLPGVLSFTDSALSNGDVLVYLVPKGADDGDVAQGVVRRIRGRPWRARRPGDREGRAGGGRAEHDHDSAGRRDRVRPGDGL